MSNTINPDDIDIINKNKPSTPSLRRLSRLEEDIENNIKLKRLLEGPLNTNTIVNPSNLVYNICDYPQTLSKTLIDNRPILFTNKEKKYPIYENYIPANDAYDTTLPQDTEDTDDTTNTIVNKINKNILNIEGYLNTYEDTLKKYNKTLLKKNELRKIIKSSQVYTKECLDKAYKNIPKEFLEDTFTLSSQPFLRNERIFPCISNLHINIDRYNKKKNTNIIYNDDTNSFTKGTLTYTSTGSSSNSSHKNELEKNI